MALFDDLSNPEKLSEKPRMKCTVCVLLKALDKKEADKLIEVIDDPSVTKAAVARILQDNGYKITGGTLTRHARRECSRN